MKIVDILYRLIDRGREGKNIGISTGLSKIDQYTGGIQKSIYTLVFAQSGVGKSSYVLYAHIYRLLKDNPNKPINLIYYSLEMGAEVLLAKLLGLYIYEEYGQIIEYSKLLSWRDVLEDELYQYVLASKKWLESVQDRLIIFDKTLSAKSFYASIMPLLKQWGDFVTVDEGKRTIYTKHNEDQLVLVIIDHLGLVKPSNGRSKKQEMDEVSAYAVSLRERCQVSFTMIMQENRNTGDMDRIRGDMAEPTANDLKNTGDPYNDCNICIALYNPLLQKIKNYRGYKIIIDNAPEGSFDGMRDYYRAAILLKNRFGSASKAISLNFFGELGLFKELPKSHQITDYTPYITLASSTMKKKIKDEEKDKKQLSNALLSSKNIEFKF